MGHFSRVRLGTSGGRESLWPQKKKENKPEANRIDCVKEPRALGNTLLDRLSQHAPFQVLNTSLAHTHTHKGFSLPPHTPRLPSHSFSSSFSHSVLLFSMLSLSVTHTLQLCFPHSPSVTCYFSLYYTHTHTHTSASPLSGELWVALKHRLPCCLPFGFRGALPARTNWYLPSTEIWLCLD